MKTIKESSQPCRFQLINPHTILDVCHNLQGFEALFEQVSSHFDLTPDIRINVLLAASTTKDVSKVIEFLDQ